MKKYILVISALFIMMLASFLFVSAQQERFEEKIYCKATIDDDFTDDRVIIVLNRETTRQFREYTTEDFPEIDCVQVYDLSAPIVDWVEAQLAIEPVPSEPMLVDITEFRRILSLELREKSKENVLRVIKLLEERNDVLSAEPNYTFVPPSNYPDNLVFTSPNDPRWSTWGHWAVEKIQAPEAWEIATGSPNIVVGIIDTGIDFTHPDLVNRMDQRSNVHRHFLTANASLGTSETPFDIWVGYHPYHGMRNGHGTQTAGIIGGEGGNGRGVPGINWDVRLVSLRTYNNDEGALDPMIRAINYATSISIPIIDLAHQNTSASGSQQTSLRSALNAYTGLAVSSAGNHGYNLDNTSTPTYPAVMSGDRHVVVGALDANDNKASYSNYGSKTVDLFSYGERVLTTAPGGGYTYFGGTSSSAPLVTGVAALIKAGSGNNYYMDAKTIKKIILKTVDQVMSAGLCVTNGSLNAYNAIDFTVNSWKPCLLGCHYQLESCLQSCQDGCWEILEDPTCLQNPPYCQMRIGDCLEICNAWPPYLPCYAVFNQCLTGCS